MFKPVGLFSNILCPNSEKCMLPRCIFKHAEPKTEERIAGAGKVEISTADSSHEGQRKRLKVSLEGADSQISIAGLAAAKQSVSGAEGTAPSRPVEKKSLREISPPPLRRKPQIGALTQKPQKGTSLARPQQQVRSSSTLQASSKTPVKVPVKTPIKEALYPRHLQKAPAKLDIRIKYLQAVHEQMKRLNGELAKDAKSDGQVLVLTSQELISKALDFEASAAISHLIYSNVIKNQVLAYKRMSVVQWKEERQTELAQEQAQRAPVSETPVSKLSGPPKEIDTGLKLEEELTIIPRLLTPVAGLLNNAGYVINIPKDEEIQLARKGVEAAMGYEVCDRCRSRFQIFPGRREEDGALASGGDCTHHPGKVWSKKYRCCNEPVGDTAGCVTAENHVFKISEVKRLASILNFEHTAENTSSTVTERPVCIDGEMGYTVHGMELIRLTATSWPNYEVLVDVLVRPIGEVLDLNSRYSGVWPQDMADAIPWDPVTEPLPPATATEEKRNLRIVSSPAAARALLCSFITPSTPIIGHGLENDLSCLRLVHPTIIDTALLFPHRGGLPYRNSLKALMHLHLNRDIQVEIDGQISGHDSKEDANAAGDLVRFQLKNEWTNMQQAGWTLRDGAFVAPAKTQADDSVSGSTLTATAGKVLVGKKRSREESEASEKQATAYEEMMANLKPL